MRASPVGHRIPGRVSGTLRHASRSACPAARCMAPSTPPPPSMRSFAAFAIAAELAVTSLGAHFVRSPRSSVSRTDDEFDCASTYARSMDKCSTRKTTKKCQVEVARRGTKVVTLTLTLTLTLNPNPARKKSKALVWPRHPEQSRAERCYFSGSGALVLRWIHSILHTSIVSFACEN